MSRNSKVRVEAAFGGGPFRAATESSCFRDTATGDRPTEAHHSEYSQIDASAYCGSAWNRLC